MTPMTTDRGVLAGQGPHSQWVQLRLVSLEPQMVETKARRKIWSGRRNTQQWWSSMQSLRRCSSLDATKTKVEFCVFCSAVPM